MATKHPLLSRWIPLIAALALLGFMVWGRYYVKNGLEDEIGKIRAAGDPLTSEELHQWYISRPEAGELHTEIEKAFEFYDDGVEPDRNHIDHMSDAVSFDEIPEDTIQAYRAHLDLNRAYFDHLIASARTYTPGYFSIDYTQGWNTQFPQYAKLRNAARDLVARVRLSVHAGDIADANDCLFAAFTLGDSLNREPNMIGQLVRAAIFWIWVRSVETNFEELDWNSTQMNDWNKRIESAKQLNTLKTALVGERSNQYVGIKKIIDGDEDPEMYSSEFGPFFEFMYGSWLRRYYFEWELLNALRGMDSLIAMTPLEGTARHEAITAWDVRWDNRSQVGAFLPKIIFPAIPRAFDAELRMQSQLLLVQTAMDIRRILLNNAQIPTDDEIQAILPDDPFDEQPLRFRIEPDAIVLWSVSHNRVDDGGVPAQEGEKMSESGDLVFRVPVRLN